MLRNAIILALSFASAAAAQQQPVNELISKMTTEEKLGQLSQFVADQPEMKTNLPKGLVGSMLNGRGAASTNEFQRNALAGSRLKVPLLIGYDVIHGYRTIFPIPLAIASTWDAEAAELSARIAAIEARAAGIHWTFAPMVDVARDARWGRIAEGSGEDPHLGSVMAAAYVRGFHAGGLLTCAKHFAAYGAAEGGRDYNTTDMSERTLREVYLPPFKAAVDAGVDSLMSAFNAVNGVPATGNRRLLTGILRDEWKFKGFVVSDWTAVTEMIAHGYSADRKAAAAAALTAGVDMDMVSGSYLELKNVEPRTLDTAVRRVLEAKAKAGLFENALTDEARAATVTLTPENRAAARRVAQQSIVLLKNDGNLLPLKKEKQFIAVVGPLADARADMLGPWAGEGKAEETVSVLDGLRAAAAQSETEIFHTPTVPPRADLIIAVLGESREMSGEAASRTSVELPAGQQQLLEALVATGKPVILVLMSGRPLAIPWAAANVPAIVNAWFLGSEGGHAVADVLFGAVNPSGRLPVTMPRATGQLPIYHAQLRTGRPPAPAEKYTSKYIDVPIGPLYPFGYGLSYTTFEYRDARASATSASVTVKNTGSRAGTEVVQMYVGDPVASVARPLKELKAFRRITLAPGESKRIEFPITRKELEFWSDRGWIVEPGTFEVTIGPDAERGEKTLVVGSW
jgi:beta-glucosidase